MIQVNFRNCFILSMNSIGLFFSSCQIPGPHRQAIRLVHSGQQPTDDAKRIILSMEQDPTRNESNEAAISQQQQPVRGSRHQCLSAFPPTSQYSLLAAALVSTAKLEAVEDVFQPRICPCDHPSSLSFGSVHCNRRSEKYSDKVATQESSRTLRHAEQHFILPIPNSSRPSTKLSDL